MLDVSPPPDAEAFDAKYYDGVGAHDLAARLLVRARRDMYEEFVRRVRPSAESSILDVGVSDVQNAGANHLEQMHPHPQRIQACGLGEGLAFRERFPEIAYRRIEADAPLPFDDDQFDVATSNAVLEHVGGEGNQRRFVSELLRVAPVVFVTVPNRFFPVEHHTAIPFAHFHDATFGAVCRALGKERWGDPAELILMSRKRLGRLVPDGATVGYCGLRLGPCSSNLFAHYSRGRVIPPQR